MHMIVCGVPSGAVSVRSDGLGLYPLYYTHTSTLNGVIKSSQIYCVSTDYNVH